MSIEKHIKEIFVGNTPREPGNVVEFIYDESTPMMTEGLLPVMKFYIEFSSQQIVTNGSMQSARKRFVDKMRHELYKDLYEDLLKLKDAVQEERKGATLDILDRVVKEIKGDK